MLKEFVEYYTSCELSFPDKDKLVAVSRVARRLDNSDNYLAGLWDDALPLIDVAICRDIEARRRSQICPIRFLSCALMVLGVWRWCYSILPAFTGT
jgi:hypothetical protein